MKSVRILTVLAAAVFLLATGAQAQQPGPFLPSYITLTGGVFAPEGTDLDDNNADTGFAGLMNFGYMMTPFFGAQTDIGYFETSGDNNLQVSAIPVALSFKLAVPIAFVEPYLLAGGGIYFCQTEVGALDDNSTEFAAHAAAGLNFNFGRLQVGAETRYIWLEADDLNVDGLMVLGKIGSRF